MGGLGLVGFASTFSCLHELKAKKTRNKM